MILIQICEILEQTTLLATETLLKTCLLEAIPIRSLLELILSLSLSFKVALASSLLSCFLETFFKANLMRRRRRRRRLLLLLPMRETNLIKWSERE